MPYVEGYAKVRVWVPPGRPEFPGLPDFGRPDQGLPPGEGGEGPWEPGFPDTGFPPGRPEFPGFPERPGHPLPPSLPGRGPWPIVPEPGDLGGHPPLPDLDMPGRWSRVTTGRARSVGDGWPAWIVYGEPPEVDEGYEARHPEHGIPGEWVVCLYRDDLAWAWVPDVRDEDGGEDGGEDARR